MGIGIIIILIAVIIGVVALMKHFRIQIKSLPTGSFVTVVGGVKCGKTTYAVHLARRHYKKALLKYYIRKYVFMKKDEERPLFYSNIPVTWKYVPVTQDLILRKKRFNYKSVILLDEASLIADSQSYKNIQDNDEVLKFAKLIGHETLGGLCVLDTQSLSDMHYAFKRTTSQYQWISRLIKWVPFLLIAEVIEQRYSEDLSVTATDNRDIQDITKKVIIPKSIWKKFDAYCYSKLTDDLPVENHLVTTDELKTDIIVSFNKSIATKGKRPIEDIKKITVMEPTKEQNNNA